MSAWEGIDRQGVKCTRLRGWAEQGHRRAVRAPDSCPPPPRLCTPARSDHFPQSSPSIQCSHSHIHHWCCCQSLISVTALPGSHYSINVRLVGGDEKDLQLHPAASVLPHLSLLDIFAAGMYSSDRVNSRCVAPPNSKCFNHTQVVAVHSSRPLPQPQAFLFPTIYCCPHTMWH